MQFIKEAHGNVFRRVALSALLDSAEKITTAKKMDEKEEAKQSGGRRYACGRTLTLRAALLITTADFFSILSIFLSCLHLRLE